MKILVVDDNPVNRKLMEQILSDHGECSAAADGLEAVEMFTQALKVNERDNLVCLDIMIPKLDGQEVLRQLRAAEREAELEEPERSKVMMVSSLDDSENIMQAFTKGHCDAYIMKPISRAKMQYHLQEMNLIV